MRRLICAYLIVGLICTLSGCQKAGLPQPDFPLTEEVVTAALEQTGLPGAISESETQSNSDGHVLYTLRTQPESRQPTAFVESVLTDRKRSLHLFFNSSPVTEAPPFAWEDWKQQLIFSALLYGGFSDAEELYRAFSEKSASEGAVIIPDPEMSKYYAETLAWDASFPAGYCRVRYDLNNTSIESSSLGNSVLEQTPRMTINIYKSEAQYQNMIQKAMAAKEETERARSAASN